MPDFDSFRSPETRHEVKAAAGVLFALGVIFVLVSLAGFVWRFVFEQGDAIIIAAVFGAFAPLLFAAGAYNIYYTRRMQHAPAVAAALRNPIKTVVAFMLIITAIVAGLAAALVYWG